MEAQKPRREQLCPQLAKAEVREELLTDRCNLPKHPKEKDKYVKYCYSAILNVKLHCSSIVKKKKKKL